MKKRHLLSSRGRFLLAAQTFIVCVPNSVDDFLEIIQVVCATEVLKTDGHERVPPLWVDMIT